MNAATWYAEGTTIDIQGLNIFFKRTGKGQALICIHGFPSSSWDFASLWPALIQRFDVMMHDLIGLGKSAKPNHPIPIRLQADIIEELAVQAGVREAHLLAHDLGDTIAQELLARQAEKSSKINWLSCVFLNGGLFPETHRALLVQQLLLSPLGPLLARFMTEKSMRKSLSKVFSSAHPATDEFLHDTWKLTAADHGTSMLPRLIHYITERKLNRERWVTPLVNKVVPIRLINGLADPVSGEHAANRFDELIAGADIVRLQDCGHYPHVELPDEVLRAIFDFHDRLFSGNQVPA